MRCYDPQFTNYRKFDCAVHFCSRSILIESHEDSKPIYKYLFKYLNTPPTMRKPHPHTLTVAVHRPPKQRVPAVFRLYSLLGSLLEHNTPAVQATLDQRAQIAAARLGGRN